MYGETAAPPSASNRRGGLSPHVRGNHRMGHRRWQLDGSIPACTGKPGGCSAGGAIARVYPRMYGEAPGVPLPCQLVGGLSPHVRGNHHPADAGLRRAGSIPACTGKPRLYPCLHAVLRVYPRMYGETSPARNRASRPGGLSPHVRGNRGAAAGCNHRRGSIPACTGKPATPAGGGSSFMVYPRMYGETCSMASMAPKLAGLSPHVRGNQQQRIGGPLDERSIPACTGKPRQFLVTGSCSRVYPRMYGETCRLYTTEERPEGLSPHVRGNLSRRNLLPKRIGSIPACTGKPFVFAISPPPRKVYPRMYGETLLPSPAGR